MQPVAQLVRHSGNEALLDAVELSVLSHTLGWPLHLHAEGVRGTGKTTVLRSARSWLPRMRRVKDCLFNCDPDAPHCPRHRDLSPDELQAIGWEWVPMPFLEISHSAKLGTVVGTIDLRRVLDAARPEAELLPGTIAKAHRGIVFIDEINRLADTAPELVDVLLDVMGTKPGRLQIEESGLPPLELPVQVAVWAASNPDEEPGPLEDIRRQLADRFDLAIPVSGPSTVEQVRAVLDRTARWMPEAGGHLQPAPAAGQRQRLEPPRVRFPAVPTALRDRLAAIYLRFGLESLRAMEAWQWTARLRAWRAERQHVTLEDLVQVAPLILQHRIEPGLLAQVLRALEQDVEASAVEMAGASPERDHDATPPGGASPAGGPEVDGLPGRAFGHDGRSPGDRSLRGFVNRVRGWLRGQPPGESLYAQAAPTSGGLDGQAAGAGRGRPARLTADADIPAPPFPARPLHALSDDDLARRLNVGADRERDV